MTPPDLVLLTGATGMVGLRVLVRLLEYGYYVRAAVRTQAGFDRICSLPCLRYYGGQLSRIVVPDITDKWAYYEAILGVKYVVHVASPISCDNFTTVAQLRDHIIRPAVKGTVGILTAAQWSQSVKRVVITGSLVSIASEESIASGRMIDEYTWDVNMSGEITHANAYVRSKALAFAAIQDYLRQNKPPYTVINILPVTIIGRDDSLINIETDCFKGTNSLLIGSLLGMPNNIITMPGNSVHLDDVAELHVRSLDQNWARAHLMGHQTFIAAAGPMIWSNCFDIVKRRFPREYAQGVFPFRDDMRARTSVVNVNNMAARLLLGRNFKTFEEQVVSVVEQYLELRMRGQRRLLP
ncbi:hypothetical protein E4U59_001006 [Claviceps monticola]|nr:hypothetical protein E4U59_001006 [Claviceps monticola]